MKTVLIGYENVLLIRSVVILYLIRAYIHLNKC